MVRILSITVASAALTLALGATATASDVEAEPTDPPLGPPVVHEDPVGDVVDGPDLVTCGVSEPWESLVRFDMEFDSEPPLSYDLETMSTDELWVAVSTEPGPLFEDGDIEYALIVHGATLAEAESTGSGLYDTTQPEGDEVFWSVVDVEVDGPTLALAIDRKLLGDPDTLYFQVAVGSEGEGGESDYDMCPDEGQDPVEYTLYG